MKFLLKSKTILFNLLLLIMFTIDTLDHEMIVNILKSFNVNEAAQTKVFAVLTVVTILGNTFLRSISKGKQLYIVHPDKVTKQKPK